MAGEAAQQTELVIAEHDARASAIAQRAHDLEHAQVFGAPIHEVSDLPELEGPAVVPLRAGQQLLELGRAALDVPYEDPLRNRLLPCGVTQSTRGGRNDRGCDAGPRDP